VAPAPRPPNGFLASLSEDDFELVRPHLKTADLTQDLVLVEVDEVLKRAYLPHRGVISLVVKLARGEHVHIAMIGRDSVFGSFAALGDAMALNGAVVLVPGVASTLDLDRLRAAAWDVPHFGHRAAECRKALVRLHPHESLDGRAEDVGLVHAGVGHLDGLLVKSIVDGDSGTHVEPSMSD